MIVPASTTPSATASVADFQPIFKMLAAIIPVQAPVPGIGIPTNNINAKNSPAPLVFFDNFSPAL